MSWRDHNTAVREQGMCPCPCHSGRPSLCDCGYHRGGGAMNRLGQPSPLPIGTRLELIAMPGDPDPVPTGSRGTVVGGNGEQVWVDWDNGRSLMLIPGTDRWRVLP